MAKILSAIGSCKDGSVEFMLSEEKKPTEFFIFKMPTEDAMRLAKKLIEAGENARRHVEAYDVSGDNAHMSEVVGKKRMASREKFTGCYGQKSNNNYKS